MIGPRIQNGRARENGERENDKYSSTRYEAKRRQNELSALSTIFRKTNTKILDTIGHWIGKGTAHISTATDNNVNIAKCLWLLIVVYFIIFLLCLCVCARQFHLSLTHSWASRASSCCLCLCWCVRVRSSVRIHVRSNKHSLRCIRYWLFSAVIDMGQTSSHHGGSSSSTASNRASKRNSKYNKSFNLRHPRFGNEKRQSKMLTQDQIYEKLRNERNQKCVTLPPNASLTTAGADVDTPQLQQQQQPPRSTIIENGTDVAVRGNGSSASSGSGASAANGNATRPITINSMGPFSVEKLKNTSTPINHYASPPHNEALTATYSSSPLQR